MTDADEKQLAWLHKTLDDLAVLAGVSVSSLPFMAPEIKVEMIKEYMSNVDAALQVLADG